MLTLQGVSLPKARESRPALMAGRLPKCLLAGDIFDDNTKARRLQLGLRIVAAEPKAIPPIIATHWWRDEAQEAAHG